MLAPDARAVLLDELRPPVGYRLDAAVATTFTLDLAAALVPPLAFASFQLRGTPDPVAALEAVRACADRVDVFCQAGQINVPATASDLMAFLEPMIHEVRRPRGGHLFHPKLWMLRYHSDDEADSYRLLCLTRNLTADHSWDAVLRLDGIVRGGPKAANRPLAELLRALPTLAVRRPLATEREARIRQLAEEVRRLEWETPTDVNDIAFHVFGIPGIRPTVDFSGYRHLVIAPFLNDKGLATVAPIGSPDVTVVSRPDDLDRLRTETIDRIQPQVISSIAGLDEAPGANGDDQQILTGLHAKIYVVDRDRRGHIFLGSANATDAAFGGNVEVLVELVGGATKLGVQTFLADDSPFRGLLEDYATSGGAAPDPDDEAARALADLVRDLAALRYVLTVTADQDGLYRMRAATHEPLPIPTGYRVSVELLTGPGAACHPVGGVPLDAVYAQVPLADITPFLVLRATAPTGLQRGTVVRAALLNDPDGRLDEVLARQVSTPEKFLQFLALLLGLGNAHQLSLIAAGGSRNASWAQRGPGAGVFELIVRCLAEQPDAIADLDRLVRRLQGSDRGRAVLPDGFEAFWPTVMSAHDRLTKAGTR